jgi:F-type H+-transporting ATPase subunit delta
VAKLVVKRYAAALFDLAVQDNRMEEYEQEVQVIMNALKDEPDFRAVLQSKQIALKEKIDIIEKVFKDKVSASIVGLMVILVTKGRQDFLMEVFESFVEMVKNKKGILKATVTSAVRLNPDQLEKIKSNLENSTKSQIELDTILDESIIAGLVIRVGDKVVDASVKGKMQLLKKQLTELKLA